MTFERTPEGPHIYGHRGARARAPDNSLVAFELALAEGAVGVELDVRTTADAQLAIYHDRSVSHAGRDIAVADLTLGQLQTLLTPAPLTLSQVLDFRDRTGAWLNVELKGDVPSKRWLADATCRLFARRGTAGILVSSFYPELLWHVHRTLPQVPTALLLAKGNPLRPKLLTALLRRLGATAVHPELGLLTRDMARALQQAGFLVNVWTVNEERDFHTLREWGVDGIITDRPREARQALSPGESSARGLGAVDSGA